MGSAVAPMHVGVTDSHVAVVSPQRPRTYRHARRRSAHQERRSVRDEAPEVVLQIGVTPSGVADPLVASAAPALRSSRTRGSWRGWHATPRCTRPR